MLPKLLNSQLSKVVLASPLIRDRNLGATLFVRFLCADLLSAESFAWSFVFGQIRVRNLTYMQPFSPIFFVAHTKVSICPASGIMLDTLVANTRGKCRPARVAK